MNTKRKFSIKTLLKKLPVYFLKTLLVFFLLSVSSVLLLKWINPATSSVMIQRTVAALFSSKETKLVRYYWADYDEISKNMGLAVIAAEDQNFPFHFGFDVEQIQKAIKENKKGRRLRGASTITQQVAKNLFLWEGKSFIRKGLEAYFTLLIELLWTKERILEVYLNIVELGDMIFGVGAACRIYFNRTPDKISQSQAALLAAVLPNPIRYSAKYPSGYIIKRQSWILGQMGSLGGTYYIKNL